ncbi:MAG TPA: hypothetical protein VH370_17470 [Humisphaera sp.]|jgi:hypothetical protein|nr:hypothetical protein [Humisphaera sp.]
MDAADAGSTPARRASPAVVQRQHDGDGRKASRFSDFVAVLFR